MHITIVGLGLIGGSAALGLRRRGVAASITGVENNPRHAAQALELGLADAILPLPDAVRSADLVIIATPVDAARQLLHTILENIPSSAAAMDMGSTKSGICNEFGQHPKRGQFVASHPMAGTEYSGPAAAQADLFENKKAIICEPQCSHSSALERATAMYAALGADIVLYPSAQAHDRHAAYISHISHVSSFMLGLTVLEVEKDEQQILQLAGTGFASTVRLAKSSPDTWTPIFLQNAPMLSQALQAYIDNLVRFQKHLAAADSRRLRQMIAQANGIARIIE